MLDDTQVSGDLAVLLTSWGFKQKVCLRVIFLVLRQVHSVFGDDESGVVGKSIRAISFRVKSKSNRRVFRENHTGKQLLQRSANSEKNSAQGKKEAEETRLKGKRRNVGHRSRRKQGIATSARVW